MDRVSGGELPFDLEGDVGVAPTGKWGCPELSGVPLAP